MANTVKATIRRARLESKLLKVIQLQYSRGASRLFRNTVGAAFVGPHMWLVDGSLRITRPARIVYGLGVGSADLIGWKSRVIRQDDVGKRFAQFVAIECKSPKGTLTAQQRHFLEVAWDCGALAGIARSLGDVEKIIAGEPLPQPPAKPDP